MAKVDYQEAVRKRQSQNSVNSGPQRSVMENVADIWASVRSKAEDYADSVAPNDPEERVQKGFTAKVGSDDLKARAGYVGEHLGSKVHTVAGSVVTGAWSFLKAAAGRSNDAVANRLAEIDGSNTEDKGSDDTTSNS